MHCALPCMSRTRRHSLFDTRSKIWATASLKTLKALEHRRHIRAYLTVDGILRLLQILRIVRTVTDQYNIQSSDSARKDNVIDHL